MVVLIAFMALAGTARLRIAGTALAVVFALAVGASRVYLGDHYPTDVLGSYLTVAAAALLVSAFTDLPRVRRVVARLLRSPGIAVAPARRSARRRASPDLPRPGWAGRGAANGPAHARGPPVSQDGPGGPPACAGRGRRGDQRRAAGVPVHRAAGDSQTAHHPGQAAPPVT